MNLIIKAANFARDKHEGQVRKYSGVPYITHPARIATAVTLYPESTEKMVAAAWLHDVLEDCDSSYIELRVEFGETVANLVYELTNDSKIVLPNGNREQRKQHDIARISKISRQAKIIKLMDRFDNLGELPLDNKTAVNFLRSAYLDESDTLHQVLKDADEHLAFALKHRIDAIRKLIGD